MSTLLKTQRDRTRQTKNAHMIWEIAVTKRTPRTLQITSSRPSKESVESGGKKRNVFDSKERSRLEPQMTAVMKQVRKGL